MNLKKELSLILIVLIPFFYLTWIWNELPTKVPVHWNLNGEIDRYGNKLELLLIPVLFPLLSFLIFTVAPLVDPKKKISKMGIKFQNLKVLITSLMSVIAIFILYSAKNDSAPNTHYVVLSIGILFSIIGNYLKTIRANYFIGIRTPWTLENEAVWKKTHVLGGKLWFTGGVIIILLSFYIPPKSIMMMLMIITAIITVIPVTYSYLLFKKQQDSLLN